MDSHIDPATSGNILSLPKALIVEDEPSMQVLLRFHLTRVGFDVTIASNGLDGKSCLEKNDYDVVCSDVMMSGFDGIELCAWAKKHDRVKKIPFILLSSRGQIAEKELGIQAGADAYLTKPFDIEHLIAILKQLVDSCT